MVTGDYPYYDEPYPEGPEDEDEEDDLCPHCGGSGEVEVTMCGLYVRTEKCGRCVPWYKAR